MRPLCAACSYIIGTFVIGLIVSPDDPNLTNGDGVNASPWVIVRPLSRSTVTRKRTRTRKLTVVTVPRRPLLPLLLSLRLSLSLLALLLFTYLSSASTLSIVLHDLLRLPATRTGHQVRPVLSHGPSRRHKLTRSSCRNAGIQGLPSVVNAAVLLSAFSAGNSDLYASSRTLYGLACDGKAPAIFRRCTKGGLPIYCVIITAAIGLLAYMNVSTGSTTAFNYLSKCVLLSPSLSRSRARAR